MTEVPDAGRGNRALRAKAQQTAHHSALLLFRALSPPRTESLSKNLRALAFPDGGNLGGFQSHFIHRQVKFHEPIGDRLRYT
ncbi:hypothetical protein R4P64_29350 [Rhodococcus sp. IEGM 1366]|uniref:hypothetical protein n=1 Tax=Rhodococcus sp. IEGM 1366 TaxID=3082223 RepID=UPI002955C066|nr:hypothetical protein [Rhodococcus sp. IEGM 1366]MDV8070646.1 hypothetical protein [Rhodococcus sp. IEGM 1366]